MLEEFKKINNARQQRKYLDKLAVSLRKEEMNFDQVKEVLELNEYLEQIHFWSKYDGLFEQTVKQADMLYGMEKVKEKKELLDANQKNAFDSAYQALSNYEKDVVVDFFDAYKHSLKTIMVYGTQYSMKHREESLADLEYYLMDCMEKKGSLEVHYFNGRRVLKKIKL